MKSIKILSCLTLGLGLAAFGWGGIRPRSGFDHRKHVKLFPTCQQCHAGAEQAGLPIWPAAESCASCHDGTIQKKSEWSPPAPTPSNLKFTHGEHAGEFGRRHSGDSALVCTTCHQPAGAGWMQVVRTQSQVCLDCHQVRGEHLAVADTACATCHLTLAEARSLPEARVAGFPAPPSHKAASFMSARSHGLLARPPAGSHQSVAASCATCHARDFCASCHVNARQVALIQALAPDPRSLAIKSGKLDAPASHADGAFQTRHGGMAERSIQSCATCHTQESCTACHRAQPGVATGLIAAAAGPAAGAQVKRTRPGSHNPSFSENHGPLASSRPGSCAACHARSECLDCHRSVAGNSQTYHRAGFLTTHPSASYNRQTDCAECHNTQQFCTTCHVQSGLTSKRALQAGYHDANPSFLLQHGPSARRELESCVTCHTERDCLTCHSAQTRRFNPHGPGFDAERLRRRNPQTCSACHGQNIPG